MASDYPSSNCFCSGAPICPHPIITVGQYGTTERRVIRTAAPCRACEKAYNDKLTDRRRKRVLAANPVSDQPGASETGARGGGSCGALGSALLENVLKAKDHAVPHLRASMGL